MQIRAIALDAFGTVIQYGQRLAPYSRLLARRGEGAARLPFLTRDVPVATFAAELGLEHLLPDLEGRPFYVSLAEIPHPWRDQFWAALYGSQCPKIEGVERAAYAWDWECWVHGSWYGRHGPEGLQP